MVDHVIRRGKKKFGTRVQRMYYESKDESNKRAIREWGQLINSAGRIVKLRLHRRISAFFLWSWSFTLARKYPTRKLWLKSRYQFSISHISLAHTIQRHSSSSLDSYFMGNFHRIENLGEYRKLRLGKIRKQLSRIINRFLRLDTLFAYGLRRRYF